MQADCEKAAFLIVCEIDSEELACRIFEGLYSLKRPPGFTAGQALQSIAKNDPEGRAGLVEAAMKATEYLAECMRNGKRSS